MQTALSTPREKYFVEMIKVSRSAILVILCYYF